MSEGGESQEGRVIDSLGWLLERIEGRIEAGAISESIRYINRFLAAARDTRTKLWGYRMLGMLTFRHGRIDRARRAFERATELRPDDPGLAYALGHCAAAEGRWWRALTDWLEAMRSADDRDDQAEFLRAAGVAVHRLGRPDTALSMLLGAMERAPQNPWVLESIGHIYEHEQMWMEALGVREALIDVLSDGLVPADPEPAERFENAQFYRVFQAFAFKFDIDREAIEQRRRRITDRLRSEIGLADPDRPRDAREPTHLAPMQLPRGLFELVAQLSEHERNFRLLETAQLLWARAGHERFDLCVTPMKLAAVLQWVIERLDWRIPTPVDELTEVYGVEADVLRAAARLVVGHFEVAALDVQWAETGLSLGEWRRFEQVQQAILVGGRADRQAARMLAE